MAVVPLLRDNTTNRHSSTPLTAHLRISSSPRPVPTWSCPARTRVSPFCSHIRGPRAHAQDRGYGDLTLPTFTCLGTRHCQTTHTPPARFPPLPVRIRFLFWRIQPLYHLDDLQRHPRLANQLATTSVIATTQPDNLPSSRGLVFPSSVFSSIGLYAALHQAALTSLSICSGHPSCVHFDFPPLVAEVENASNKPRAARESVRGNRSSSYNKACCHPRTSLWRPAPFS
jgi:hypothetical protein